MSTHLSEEPSKLLAGERPPDAPDEEDSEDTNDELVYYGSASFSDLTNLSEVWKYRELVGVFVGRDLRVRYRQTIVGVAWAVVRPVVMLLIFGLFFRLLGRTPSQEGVPYLLSFLCGYLPWQFLASGLTSATLSLVSHQGLIDKVYFPRLVLPTSAVLVGLADFVVGLAVLFFAMVAVGFTPSWTIVLLPIPILLLIALTISLSIWASSINALYRDAGHMVPFVLQVGFFVSPVVYDTGSLVPPEWYPLYVLNPAVGVLESFRFIVLGGEGTIPALSLLSSVVIIAVIGITGMLYFHRVEKVLADRI